MMSSENIDMAQAMTEKLLNASASVVPFDEVTHLGDTETKVYSTIPKSGQSRLPGNIATDLNDYRKSYNEMAAPLREQLVGSAFAHLGERPPRILVQATRRLFLISIRIWILNHDGQVMASSQIDVRPDEADLSGGNWDADVSLVTGNLKQIGADRDKYFELLKRYRYDPVNYEPAGLFYEDWAGALPGNTVAVWPVSATLFAGGGSPTVLRDQLVKAGSRFKIENGTRIIAPRFVLDEAKHRTPRRALANLIASCTEHGSPSLTD